jgi:hypothetical protein
MPLIAPHPLIPTRTLLLTGIPFFVAAVAFSLLSHIAVHASVGEAACGPEGRTTATVAFMTELHPPHSQCGWSALAGVGWTLALALASFAALLRLPGNLFVASMAFVNATARLPEIITVFLQYLIHGRSLRPVDESLSLGLLGPIDPTIPMVISCFYAIGSISFAVIVVHDTKGVKYKWLVAAALLALMPLLERAIIALF